jgi:PAS domain S-box-containing protein
MEMTSAQTWSFWRLAAQYILGGIGLVLLTFVCFQIGLGLATTAFVYLLLITLMSLTGSFIGSAILSIIAVACLAYFFGPPFFDFRVDSAQHVVIVIAFLLISLIVTRLVGGARKQAKALRHSETYLTEAQRLSRTGSFGWRVSNGEILWSEETFRIFQYDRTTKPTLERVLHRVHPEDAAFVKQTLERASQDGKDFDYEHRLLMPDGSIKHLRVVAHAISDESGNLEFVGAVMDVTAAKEAESRIQLIIDTVPAFIWTARPDGRVDFISQRNLDYMGKTLQQKVELERGEQCHPDDLGQVLSKWRAAVAGGQPFQAEMRVRRVDGEYRWFLTRAFPLLDRSGQVLGWYGNDIDIHDRKQAEEKLQRSEAYLHEAQRLGHMGNFAINFSSGAFIASPEFLRIFGYDPDKEKPTREMLRECIHPEDLPYLLERVNKARSEKADYDFDYRIVLRDGSIRHVHSVAHPVFDDIGGLVEYVGTTMDVTEQKQTEQSLYQGEKRFRAMVEKSAEGILLMLPEKGIIYASPSVERVLGYTSEELTNQSIQSLEERLVHPDYKQQAIDHRTQVQREPDRESTAEIMARHKDGSWRWIESTIRNLLHEPSVHALVANFRDITERKRAQAERERLEQRLRQAEKMEAVGRLAGGIAHDFNNVLAGVFAYGEMLFEEAPAHSPLRRYAQNVLTGASRGRELVEQILAYSRSQRGKRQPVDVANVVAETLELLRGSLPPGIRLEASAAESPLVVIGDAIQLHQVVMNLCSNAIQAMSAEGSLRVALGTADVSAEQALSHGTLEPGRYARLIVEDSGSGIDEATRSRIFEPFFTTKEVGQGTGLGLSLVYAIITDSGGAIDVKSAPQQGSTFTIYLRHSETTLAATEATAAPPPRGHGERVLLIDDEAPVLAVTAEVLSRLGYEAVSFSDSHAALAAFEAAPEQFDVVVTDEVMPGLTGTGLARVFRHHRPDLPIVLMSGYSGASLTQDALAAGVRELLTKPLQSREMAATLARVLHRTA